MNPLSPALDTLQGNFGAIDRVDFLKEHPGSGTMLAMGLVSHGFARETKDDRLVMTDAGWKAARAYEQDDGA